jgi:hypothetical protein
MILFLGVMGCTLIVYYFVILIIGAVEFIDVMKGEKFILITDKKQIYVALIPFGVCISGIIKYFKRVDFKKGFTNLKEQFKHLD